MKNRIPSISLGASIKDLDMAKRIGATAVDLSTLRIDGRKTNVNDPDSLFSKGESAVVEYYQGIKEYADKLGITICQTHGRISGFKDNKELDDALVESAMLDLAAAKAMGAPFCVMHSVTTINMGPDCPREKMHALNYDMFSRILDKGSKYGVTVATETFGDAVKFDCCDFFGNIDEFEESYERICGGTGSELFKICVDTGHSNKAMRFNNNPKPADVIRRLGKNIVCLHLNDNDTLTDQHKIPAMGTIDWNDVFDALDEIDYNGYYNMELNLSTYGAGFVEDTAAFAIKMMNNLLRNKYGE